MYNLQIKINFRCVQHLLVTHVEPMLFKHTAILGSGALTSYLDIPHMAPISSDVSVSDKSVYTTLVRTNYPLDTIGNF